MISPSNLGVYLDLWNFYDDTLVFGDGSLGYGFKIKGKDISCETISKINIFNSKLEGLISSLNEGISLQVFYHLSPEVDNIINSHIELSKSTPSMPYEQILNSRTDFLKKNRINGHYFKPDIYLFIKSKSIHYKSKNIFSKEKEFVTATEDQFKSHYKNFEKQINQVTSSLKSMGIYESDLDRQDWLNLLYKYFNLARSEKLPAPKFQQPKIFQSNSLVSQLILTDMKLYKNFLEIGSYKFKVISLKSLPELTESGMIDNLIKLPFHCFISQSIKMCDQSAEYKKLNIKRKLNHSMASGSTNVSDLESESALGQIEGLLSELLDSTEKVVESDLSFIIWGETERELEDKEDEILRTIKRLSGAEGIVETYANFDAFLKLAPGLCKMNRAKKMKSSNASHLLPVYSYWQGNSRPVCLIPNRDNVLVGIDPFHPKLPNWNGFIIGSSGSGKSFALNSLILQFIGDQSHD